MPPKAAAKRAPKAAKPAVKRVNKQTPKRPRAEKKVYEEIGSSNINAMKALASLYAKKGNLALPFSIVPAGEDPDKPSDSVWSIKFEASKVGKILDEFNVEGDINLMEGKHVLAYLRGANKLWSWHRCSVRAVFAEHLPEDLKGQTFLLLHSIAADGVMYQAPFNNMKRHHWVAVDARLVRIDETNNESRRKTPKVEKKAKKAKGDESKAKKKKEKMDKKKDKKKKERQEESGSDSGSE